MTGNATAMRTILVFGTTGQVGRALGRLTPPAGHAVRALSRAEADATDRDAVAAAIAAPDVALVINATAYTAVDRAESEERLAFAVNRDGPAAMAAACAARGIPFLHVSTDYVFDGAKDGAWTEDDPVAPLSVYGASKAAGEAAIREACQHHVIMRTSWVFATEGQNFVRTMLRVGAERDTLRIVDDQVGGPTPAEAIASALMTVAGRIADGSDRFGTYHFAGTPKVSWHSFAQAIFAEARALGVKTPDRIDPIPTSAYPTPARRPLNSVLDTTRITAAFGIRPPDWRSALARAVAALARPAEDRP